MKYLLTLLFFAHISIYGQSVKLREIRLKPNSKYFNTTEKTIIYPIIVTTNKRADSLINSQIKDDVFEIDEEKRNINEILAEHINDYDLINLSYEITYNNDGLLSFSIFSEGCGAYCSSKETYFNFDIKTGQKITISDLLLTEKLNSFRNIVFADKVKALTQYKIEESNLANPNIDSTVVNWALEQVDENCINSVKIDDFSLSSLNIEINDICEFPHAIRSQEPSYELKYSYLFISHFLRPKFRNILMK
ncbi:MAG: hypothetical protein ABI405_09060 [Parafilimonas sp.]